MPDARTGGLEQTILPSPHVALLAPDHRETYAHRLGDVTGTAAEHYQANSRLRPWELAELPAEDDAEAVREWFLRSGRSYDPACLVPGAGAPQRPLAELPGPIAALLGRFGPDGPMATSLYAADLIVALDDTLTLMPPTAMLSSSSVRCLTGGSASPPPCRRSTGGCSRWPPRSSPLSRCRGGRWPSTASAATGGP